MKPPATLSLDLDDKWSYLKTHGDPAWRDLPSYLPLAVPRVLDFLRARGLTITVFIVGRDAARPENRDLLRAIADAGHEIGNHSFHHEPWLHLYPEPRLEAELARAEDAVADTTGRRPVGFRGPGFSCSSATLRILRRRGYLYDASTLPTFLGPLARAYYFRTSRLGPEERRRRAALFGTLGEGLRPVKPYRWRLPEGDLLEIPVTTLPLLRVPIHVSYLLYLATYSPRLARAYCRGAFELCRATGTPPSLLLHPLDFLGGDDDADLGFFPAMALPGAAKVALVGEFLDLLSARFKPLTMQDYARGLTASPDLRVMRPQFDRPNGDGYGEEEQP